MRLPPEGSSLPTPPTQKQGTGWETSAALRAAGERESIPLGEPPSGRARGLALLG